MFNKGKKEENIKEFIEITAADLEEKIAAGEEAIVYIGKSSCPFCRKFVPKLDNVRKEKGLTIHYVDSQDTPKNQALQNIRAKLGVEFVPSMVTVDGPGKFTNLHIDSSTSEEELISLLVK